MNNLFNLDSYKPIRKVVRRTAQKYFSCCFIHGKPGLGKSVQVEEELKSLGFKLNDEKLLPVKENEFHYIIFSGDMSPAYVYRFLYEHNGKVIIFRDMVRLVSNLRSIDILRAATETHGLRKVEKANYSRLQKDLPDSFIIASRFIFELNTLHFYGRLRDEMESLVKSRGVYHNILLSFEEVAQIMRQIAQTKSQKAVTEFLIKNYRIAGWNRFDLRTQAKAFQIYKSAIKDGLNWQDEIKEDLEAVASEARQSLFPYIGSKAIRSSELKKIMVQARIGNCHTLRSADRRIRDYVLMQELFIPGKAMATEEELEDYINSHRNYYLSLDPVELGDTGDICSNQSETPLNTNDVCYNVSV